ncbi:MAG: T9SS type A sorting domain-containing protein [candidate division KSB1 bacterium]|nr:T9SS type A sorting domain-containing protein [candidate division KSB1 bacterium]MDZ7367581.1 T9SS type A sorting domain-containing protein [candidate division KSB1 bacterium]MDZ7405373.1 T9SS type A sorting domain-containing protein [candidate division KSB1 bacterium]
MPVEREGVRLEYPFLGGLDLFLPQFVDIDADGDADLFISDADRKLMFFENMGHSGAPAPFRFVTDHYGSFEINNWFYFVDGDADGDFDLYHDNRTGGMAYRVNLGTASRANFVLQTMTVLAVDGQPVANDPLSLPAFCDIDADGDFDFFSGAQLGTITLYRNVGSPTTSRFAFETNRWENLLIFSGGGIALSPARPAHGANALEFADLDHDGDQDFFYGDLFHPGVYYFRNDGNPQRPKVVLNDSLFPQPRAVFTQGYNVPRFSDVDADGDCDFFVACRNQITNNFLFYKNAGTATQPQFQQVTSDFLSMIDAGISSAPACGDVDGDGDQDVLIGNLNGQLIFYENTGTRTAPALRWVTDAFQNLRVGDFSAKPAFADIDADSDLDLFVGAFSGKITFFENRGTPRVPRFALVTNAYGNLDVGEISAPSFADFDGDGDLDLFIGEQSDGSINIYENAGTAGAAQFIFKRELRHAGPQNYSQPALFDWNRDGIMDLFVGVYEGVLLYYRGLSPARDFQFALQEETFAGIDVGFGAAPVFVDWDGDGAVDLLVGEEAGGLNFYRNSGRSAVADRNVKVSPPGTFALELHPNPFHERVTITLYLAPGIGGAPPQAGIYNLLGARVAELELKNTGGQWHASWSPLHFAAGVYFLHVHWERMQFSRKLLLIR